jgi:hypothetical protein
MKCAHTVCLILILCLTVVGSSRGQTPSESHEQFICTSGPVKRVVSIYKKESGACRVDYKKGGETTTVWKSNKDHAYCTGKALSLVTKLVEGHFSCRPETVEKPDGTETAEPAPAPGDAVHIPF